MTACSLPTQLTFLRTLGTYDAYPEEALVTDPHKVTFHRLTQLTHRPSLSWTLL